MNPTDALCTFLLNNMDVDRKELVDICNTLEDRVKAIFGYKETLGYSELRAVFFDECIRPPSIYRAGYKGWFFGAVPRQIII